MAAALVGLAAIVSMAITGVSTLYAAVGGSGTACTSDSPCALTEALSSATSGGTVDLAAGTYLAASGNSFTIATSLSLEPTTPGSAVTLEGNDASVVAVNSSVTATVSGVSIEDGSAAADGGGVTNAGSLTVEDSTISGNTATNGGGGGVSNSGTLSVLDSTISANTATNGGGGVFNSGTLSVEDSTISANSAGGGGGIFNSGTATVEAATITGNFVTTGGDDDDSGGGINNSSASSLTLAADIMAAQGAGGDCSIDPGTVTDAGYNADDDGTCGLSVANGSILDSPVIDDYLGPLGPNGGPTETVPLLATPSPTTSSPDPALGVIPSTFALPIAVNGVSLACSVPDQRGVTPDQPCDVGAFNLDSDAVAFVADGGGPVASITGLDGSSITLPSDTYAGYTFSGWFSASSGGTEVGGAGASYAILVGGATLYARWNANATDAYSFNTAGGSPTPAAGSGLDGTTITLPTAPTLSGYAFAGWNDGTTTNGAGATYTLSSGGSPIVFTAQWSANATDAYSFNTAGGSPTPAAGSGLDGTTITLPPAPTQAGYTFAGWATTPTTSSGEMAPPAGYSASQLYFDDQFTGTSLNTSNWTPALAPGGVWDDESLGAPYSSGGTYQAAYWGPAQVTVDNGVTLAARHTTSSDVGYSKGFKWVSGVITSNFTLPSSGWYVQISAKMPDTSDGMWPALWFFPANTDQEFDGFEGGWQGSSPNDQGHSDLFLSSQQQEVWSTGGTDLTAGYNTYGFQYIPGQSVTIYLNGKQVDQVSSSSVASEAYYMLIELQVASSAASGWHTVLSAGTPNPANMQIGEVQAYAYQAYSYYGAGATYSLSSGGTPIVFTAQWNADATDDYSFNAAGGASTPTSGSGLDGSTITLPSAPTRAGYTFAGWNDGTSTYGAGASYTLSSGGTAIVFTAHWTLIPTDAYSFNSAGGAPTPGSGSGPDGTAITLPKAPTRTGYTFAGWNDGTSTYGAGATYSLSSGGTPIVFTAQWNTNATDAYSFNAAGGAPTPSSGSGPDGTTITLPKAPTEAGYTFAGWNNGTSTYAAGASYTLSSGGTPIVFTAQWTLIPTDAYSFNAAGGAPTPSSGSGLDGTAMTLPSAPTRAGYTFAGWNNGTSTYAAGASYTLSSGGTPIVFTAQWTANGPVAEATTTGLSLAKTSLSYGAESTETFTVTVTGKTGDGYPKGTVSVSSSSTTLCSATLAETSSDSASAGCSLSVTALPVGSYSAVSATYTPAASSSSNTAFAYTTSGSTPATSLSVAKDTTTTTVSETPSSVVYGDESAAALSVSVTTHYGEAVPSAEKVSVKVGTATCTATLSAGKGSCTISNSALGAGTAALSASYGGDTNLGTSSASATKGLTVSKDTTTSAVSASPTTVTAGAESSAIFSVSVTTHYGEAVPSAEKVSVKVGTATCTVTLSAGKGTCTISKSALGAGTYAVSASYGGDTNLGASSASAPTKLTVKKG